VSLSDRWRQPAIAYGPITVGVMVICILIFVETYFLGNERGLKQRLFFSTDGTWRAIRDGEWWRVLTPMLMHANLFHIFFNLLIWWDFALPIESRKGSLKFLLLVIAISAFANVLQFEFGGPWFLGLSGVDFGLFGYLWMKGKLDPEDGLGVSPQQVQWLLLWFVICWFGLGGVANWCHTGGLMMGVLLGSASAGVRRWRYR
jgi:GlpG protein